MTADIRFPSGQYFTMKPHVQKFADALEAYMGKSLSFGTYAGHSPPEGPTQAVDVFNTVDSVGWAQQDQICNWIQADNFKIGYLYGIRYMIRRHHIWNIERADEGWRDQGVTGNQTADHLDHTHLTFYADAPINSQPEPQPAPTPEEEIKLWIFDGPPGVGGIWYTDGYFKWGVANQDDLVFWQNGGVKHLGVIARDVFYALRLRNDGVVDNPGVG